MFSGFRNISIHIYLDHDSVFDCGLSVHGMRCGWLGCCCLSLWCRLIVVAILGDFFAVFALLFVFILVLASGAAIRWESGLSIGSSIRLNGKKRMASEVSL